jgi:hypothetical protein
VLSWLWFLPPLAVSWLLALPGREGAVLALGWVAIWAILARFHPQKQFWHDAWAGTRLITWVAPEKPRRKGKIESHRAVMWPAALTSTCHKAARQSPHVRTSPAFRLRASLCHYHLPISPADEPVNPQKTAGA